MKGDYLDCTADDCVIGRFVVTAKEGHLLNDLEKVLEHVNRVEESLHGFTFTAIATFGKGVLITRSAASNDEPIIGFYELCIQPLILANSKFKVFFNELEPVLTIYHEKIAKRQ